MRLTYLSGREKKKYWGGVFMRLIAPVISALRNSPSVLTKIGECSFHGCVICSFAVNQRFFLSSSVTFISALL